MSEDPFSDQFKKHLKEYIDLDNEIKAANNSLKVIKKRKLDLSLLISKEMDQVDYEEIELPMGKLKNAISTKTAPLNKEWIFQRLLLICKGNEIQAQKMCDFICDPNARPKTESKTLRLTKKKLKPNKN